MATIDDEAALVAEKPVIGISVFRSFTDAEKCMRQ